MSKINFKAFPMYFKEKVYDAEGNVKCNKDGKIVYQRIQRMVRHNAAYFPKWK